MSYAMTLISYTLRRLLDHTYKEKSNKTFPKPMYTQQQQLNNIDQQSLTNSKSICPKNMPIHKIHAQQFNNID